MVICVYVKHVCLSMHQFIQVCLHMHICGEYRSTSGIFLSLSRVCVCVHIHIVSLLGNSDSLKLRNVD